MAITHLSRGNGTAKWHEVATNDLKIIFRIKNRWVHVPLRFGVCWCGVFFWFVVVLVGVFFVF